MLPPLQCPESYDATLVDQIEVRFGNTMLYRTPASEYTWKKPVAAPRSIDTVLPRSMIGIVETYLDEMIMGPRHLLHLLSDATQPKNTLSNKCLDAIGFFLTAIEIGSLLRIEFVFPKPENNL